MLTTKESEALNFLYLGQNSYHDAGIDGGLLISDMSQFKEEMQKLVEGKYVETKEDEKYKRGKYYKLTDAGIERAKEFLIRRLSEQRNDLKAFFDNEVPNAKDKRILDFLIPYFEEKKSYETTGIFTFVYPYSLINLSSPEQREELAECKNRILDKLCSLGLCVMVQHTSVKGKNNSQFYSTSDEVIKFLKTGELPKSETEELLEGLRREFPKIRKREDGYVTAGDFEHKGKGIFVFRYKPSVEIDVTYPSKIIQQVLKKHGLSAKNIGSFYYPLRKRAGLI